jgi:hypothetical protein
VADVAGVGVRAHVALDQIFQPGDLGLLLIVQLLLT